MRRNGRLAALATFVLAASMSLSAEATTLERLTLAQLASAANAVVDARCASSESRWDGGAIWSFTTFDVLETFRGLPPSQIVVRLPGGRAGHIVTTVEGAPRFRPGEEVFLFLERTRAGDYSVTAWAEGTFRVRSAVDGGSATVTQDSSSFPVFDVALRRFRTEGVRRMPIDQFRQRLRATVAAAGVAR